MHIVKERWHLGRCYWFNCSTCSELCKLPLEFLTGPLTLPVAGVPT